MQHVLVSVFLFYDKPFPNLNPLSDIRLWRNVTCVLQFISMVTRDFYIELSSNLRCSTVVSFLINDGERDWFVLPNINLSLYEHSREILSLIVPLETIASQSNIDILIYQNWTRV